MRNKKSSLMVLLVMATMLGVVIPASAEPFKSQFKRRVVGDLPTMPTSNTSPTSNTTPTQVAPTAQAKPVATANSHGPVHTADTGDWSKIKGQLNHPTNTNPVLSHDDFATYLDELENRYQGEGWRKILAALHAQLYGVDVNGKMPVPWNWNRFKHGPDSDGYKDILRTLTGNPRNNPGAFTRHTPKFVIGPHGERIDIGHAYAGLRSDLNREPGYWSRFMRWTQTDGGDSWQVLMHNDPNRAPPNQRRGNAMGQWLSTFYGQQGNKDVPLSQAVRQYFEEEGKKTPPHLGPPTEIPPQRSSGRMF